MNRSIKLWGVLLLVSVAILASCKKPKSDIGAVLFKETKNRLYKKIDSAVYYKTFRQVFEQERGNLANAALLEQFYRDNEYDPYFIDHFFPKKQLEELMVRYSQAPSHGLDPAYFNYDKLKPLVDQLYMKKGITKLDEAYRAIALTELYTANSLINYSVALHYGTVNPRKIFARYYMKTEKPDSTFMKNVLEVNNLQAYLDSIQPSGLQYKKLQEAITSDFTYSGMSTAETKKVLGLNLERLRWKNKPVASRYVWVNIADYSLTYVENGKTALTMKVCVGKGPDQEPETADYDEADNSVRPFNHTTPQLSSEIYNAQVNPIWNIPESIAKNEIYDHIIKDRYYLPNNNIDVYSKSGQKLDGDQIDWSAVNKNDIPYTFKQAPGDDNSLGKIKFQFLNASDVYLHDTPAKAPFSLQVRAVSHGCVRLEKPLDLAKALFGEGEKLNLVKKEMAEDDPTSRDIAISPKVPVYIDYMTAFADENGQVQLRPDVYKLDDVLYRRMGKALAFK